MKYAIPIFLATGLALVASAYPAISNGSDVRLNQWTYKYNEGMALAASTGRPVMLAFVNQGACTYCARWDAAVISNADGRWNAFLAANPMVLIWVDQGKSSYYANPTWNSLINGNGKWGRVTAYPEIVILTPGGARRDQFVARATLGVASAFIGRVTTAINGVPTTPVPPPVIPPVTPPTTPTGTFPAKAAGSYTGFLLDKRDGSTVRGALEMKATTVGRVTVNIVQGTVRYALNVSGVKSTASDGSFSVSASEQRSGGKLALHVDARGKISGDFNGAALAGRRAASNNITPFEGYYTSALDIKSVSGQMAPINNRPEGVGYLTLTVNSRGVVKYSGLLADGTALSGSAAMMIYDGSELAALGYAGGVAGRAYACFPLYKTLYRQRGMISAQVWIDSRTSASASDNRVWISGSEWYYPGKSALLTGDRFTADFDGNSVIEAGAFFAKGLDLAQVYTGMGLYADGQKVANVAASRRSIKADTGFIPSLQASTLTGLISGKLAIPSAAGGAVARASYKGVLVPSLRFGAGAYRLSDTSAEGYSLKRSYAVIIDE